MEKHRGNVHRADFGSHTPPRATERYVRCGGSGQDSQLHEQLLAALAQLEAVLHPLDEQAGDVAIELEGLG